MSTYCSTCGEMTFASLSHRCKPLWHARLDWRKKGDERKVYARDAAEAAELYCERYDARGDYEIIEAGEAKVVVYDRYMQLVGMFEIEAHSEPVYSALETRLTDDERKALSYEEEEMP